MNWAVELTKVGLTLVTTLVGAFAGVVLAFYFQNLREDKKERKEQKTAVNKAIHTLFQLWNVQVQYQREIIEPMRQNPSRWLTLAASMEGQYHQFAFDDDLTFVLGTTHASLYPQLLIEQQRYSIAIGLIKTRSELVLQKLHPRMQELGIGIGTSINLPALEHNLGPDLTNKLKQLTEGIITNIDENVKSTRELINSFRSGMQSYFNDDELLLIKFTESPGTRRD